MASKHISTDDHDALIDALVSGGDHHVLQNIDKAILTYAVKLTQTPSNMTEEDVNQLRSQGLDDRGIHDVCAITAYFGFVNRMADGLGVELEQRFGEE